MESRSYKDIIDDWWAQYNDNGRIPQGRESEVFAYLVQTFADIGYSRSQILRMSKDAIAYGINKNGMRKWKQRAEILTREYKKAISTVMGGTVADSIRPIAATVKDVVMAEDIPDSVEEEVDEEELEDSEIKEEPKKKSKLKVKPVSFSEDELKEVKERFNFRVGNDEDIL